MVGAFQQNINVRYEHIADYQIEYVPTNFTLCSSQWRHVIDLASF